MARTQLFGRIRLALIKARSALPDAPPPGPRAISRRSMLALMAATAAACTPAPRSEPGAPGSVAIVGGGTAGTRHGVAARECGHWLRDIRIERPDGRADVHAARLHAGRAVLRAWRRAGGLGPRRADQAVRRARHRRSSGCGLKATAASDLYDVGGNTAAGWGPDGPRGADRRVHAGRGADRGVDQAALLDANGQLDGAGAGARCAAAVEISRKSVQTRPSAG
jgi:hypothetical protein